jgi:hypothetical protein
MKMPSAPDPAATAAAQGQMNKETAVAQTGLNAMNQYTPDGKMEYSQGGTWADGTPRFSVTQTLSPDNQKLYDLTNQTSQNLGQIGVDQSKRMGDLLANPLNLGDVGMMPTGPNALNYKTAGMTQTFANPDAMMVDRQNIADNQGLEGRLIELGSRRLAPQLAQRRSELDASLADKGIGVNSDAYARASGTNAQAENDAWDQLILQGQGQAFSQAATRANNDFSQDLARTGQYVSQGQTTAQNNFMQQLGARQQYMTENDANYSRDQQGYANDMQRRQQTIDEMLAERNQPINELGALMSGSQVSKPTWSATPQSSIAPTDLIGLVNNQYNAKMSGYGGMLSALGSVAGTIGKAAFTPTSDRRLKTDIKRVGVLDNGLPVYSYRYKAGGPIHIGVMADEVEKTRPDAVVTLPSGFKAVDYVLATEAA